MDFSHYLDLVLQKREGQVELWQLVRYFSKWFFELLRNFVLVGGLKYFYEKSGSAVLFYLHELALVVLSSIACPTPTNGTSICSAFLRTSGAPIG